VSGGAEISEAFIADSVAKWRAFDLIVTPGNAFRSLRKR